MLGRDLEERLCLSFTDHSGQREKEARRERKRKRKRWRERERERERAAQPCGF